MPSMLSGQVDHVIGVDTHRDANVAAVVDAATGGVVDHFHCTTDALGYKRVLAFANVHAPARRVWASRAPAASAPVSPPSCSKR